MSQQQPQEEPCPASAAGRVAAPPAQAPAADRTPAQAAPTVAAGRTPAQSAAASAPHGEPEEQEDSTSLDYLLLRRQGQQTLDAVNALTSKIDRLVTALEGNLVPAPAPAPTRVEASPAATERPAAVATPAPPAAPPLADALAYPLANETPRHSTAVRQRVDSEAASFARAYPPHLAPVQGTPPSPTLGRALEATGRRHRLARPTVTPADYYRDRPDLRHVAVPSQASDDAGDASTGTTAGRYRPPKVDFPKFDAPSIPSDRRMIEIVGLNLKGRAQEWWVSKIKADPDRVGAIFQSWETFKLRLKALYGNIDPGTKALSELMALRQSAMPKRSASEYVERFTALLLRSNLDNDEMAVTLFKTGLEPEFLEPFERSPPQTLPDWCHKVERLDREREDNRLLRGRFDKKGTERPSRAEGAERGARDRTVLSRNRALGGENSNPAREVSRTRPAAGNATSTCQANPRVDKKLAEARALRNQRRAAGLCLGCGEAGHFLADCTKKESSKMVALLTVLEDLEASSDEGDAEDAEPSSFSESDQGNKSQDKH
ncbi:uncharacterized protein PSFLO_07217 [Pseudozyma flocculosa]|uniref:CCHC-type domain-containing protein n=1 Tax=Pseudozyma flocculosa TaxID=84751 RepID=A0A5C3FDH4_9BASI|nr:uncharacterized protein PSFLO_07217 [Pseudozyma flocculosa]